MNQLIQPNLSVVGYPDYCLAYVEQVFGVQNDPDPDAWQGWLNTKFKHADAVPNLSVPVWFSWTGTIGGITQNWGHVAVSTPQGVYTNPLTGSGHRVFPSVAALATNYGVSYVGWSEDIGNLRIIEGVKMLSKEEIIVIYDLAFDTEDSQVNPDVITAFTGKPLDELITFLHADPSWIAHKNAVNNPPAPTLNKTNVVGYINKNLQ